MIRIATTKLSSKGQVVIPEDVRKRLRLKEGHQFLVLDSGDGDSVILKTIHPPSKEEFKQLLDETARQARKAGMKKSDITKAIKKVRKRK